MKLGQFLKLAEIQTKVASMVPLFIGTFFTLYYFQKFVPLHFFLMLVSLLSFDMATTVSNNYIDFLKAYKREGYGYEKHNAIVRHQLRESTVRMTLVVLLLVAVISGFLLFVHTHILTLLIGGAAFLVGILYSFGPIPISRTPFGEMFSGFVMGYFITFLAVFIHVVDLGPLAWTFQNSALLVQIDLDFLVRILLVSWPSIIGIGNIMLANNLCDMEEDWENRRFTLPIYIGKEKALTLFTWSYYSIYVVLLIGVFSGTLPIMGLLVLGTIPLLRKNIDAFHKIQTKKDTFHLAIKNFLLVDVSLLLILIISYLVSLFL
ncbi:1,4-dihydroxy-2-naphthoate polyprenyltransferase [Alkalibacter rhizosphaerae]|uniref:1,4-dihydroxy-2-naphthoate polyprenyltransferase n=1 Tax=Alkalibacter rhizosphaerae TaxID=2815577 RepID=A0A974XG13_9FIRM|nr:1,4-dihydroxy-2-naphthoate polyprenyltransferase [Alkalibacter rhizosphaerae]QSX07955.1 1,4-dihydroxy-2-naphthoate polyprenyltransferase [Alkalibacter rhizosphaerae]